MTEAFSTGFLLGGLLILLLLGVLLSFGLDLFVSLFGERKDD